MGQKLQKSLITISLFVSILLIWGGQTIAWSQISLDSNSPLEIRFSQGETERNQTSLTVGLSDIQSILSQEFTLSSNEWKLYGESSNPEVNYYVSENAVAAAPGRIQIEDFSHQAFFISSFQNNSGHSIGNLILAYDFIYNFYDRAAAYDLALKYKVNDGEWKNVQSGIIESSSLRSDENTWSSFSIHLNIDDIFLRQSDTIHLMWVIDDTIPESHNIPIALQRMEIFPEEMDQNLLESGDIIITEILPRSNVNGSDYEYIEVYNPGENRVSLKGVEIFTSLGSKVVQRDLYVEPYDFTVISNVDISSLEGVNNSYFYDGSIVDQDRGRIGLVQEGNLIASATYEATEPGQALELNDMSRAYDGYSSLQDFAPSQITYLQDLYGSPGTRGKTSPMFTKELVESGLYILSFPGKAIQQLNRYSPLEFYSLEGEPISLDVIEPYKPVLVQKPENRPLKIFTKTEFRANPAFTPISQVTNSSAFISTPVFFRSNERSLQKSRNNSRIAPITQTWSWQKQKFELQLTNQIDTNHWSPFILHGTVSNIIKNSENPISGPTLDRSIEFTLVDDSNDKTRANDKAVLGFMDPPAQNSELRYDLPKLELLPAANSEVTRQPLLYLASTLSEENYNSFTHLPFDVTQEFEIGLGAKMTDNAGSAVLRWNLNDELPEEWVITIEDTFDGTSINLREANEYRFRYSSRSAAVNDRDQNDAPRISGLSAQDRPRFIVKIQPYASFSENTEDQETPDSIELRPNYPNPFNPSTNINFYLPEERSVRVGIYNIVGQQVALLLDDTIQQGEHSLMWDASDKPSGIYIVQLETGNRIFTRKITLIK